MAGGGDWPDGELQRWFREQARAARTEVRVVPLDALRGWHADPGTGDLRHRGGGFFTVTGLAVGSETGPVPRWEQPIISQPEIGVLGLLVRRRAGRVECLIQAKMEPGNINGVQISPTVQATRSNYTRVHGGRATPYLEHFATARPGTVVVDVLQSEQGSWFLGKRNRNMVVEARGPVEERDGFRWVRLDVLHRLMRLDNVVNMDTRTVLSCLASVSPPGPAALPARPAGHGEGNGARDGDGFGALVTASFAPPGRPDGRPDETEIELLSWLTAHRSRQPMTVRPIPGRTVRDWSWTGDEISHRDGRHFSIVGVEVRTGVREVDGWDQPMLVPRGRGVAAFLVRVVGGVLHVLVRAAAQPGLRDAVEIGPTVQCRPENYAHLPAADRPRFLDEVLSAPPERVRYDCVLSEEGGRFYHAENRYLVVEAGDGVPDDPPEDFRWTTLHRLAALTRQGHNVNVEARSLLACLHALSGATP
ncbi:NDP-hexose 2,3-dehydratase [Actinomadura logoneensis]|uniref:NDP-hexose 2,3-dehydratase n=1 Tax=Actinomadura logoneensis TaxID=2293572 RepID=A0A372JGK3_9ACTN|nr:NDP-hexose 2,3-dehydratase [Actinomadura logoneensis]